MNRQNRFIALDGLRSIAILAIIFYHLIPYQIPGGYLGVNIYFVLTGYFITDYVMKEYQVKQKLAYKSYITRRFNRLVLPLLWMMVTVTAYITLFQRDLLLNIRSWIVSSLGMYNNWWQIANGSSYFDQFYGQSPFTHLWFLSVLSQFYIIWPLVALLVLAKFKKKDALLLTTVGLSFLSIASMALRYAPGQDFSRIYYGTDTRFFAFMIGAALSILWPLHSLSPGISKKAKRRLNSIGAVAYLIVGIMMRVMLDNQAFTYLGGMYLNALVIAIVIAVTAHPATFFSKAMRFKPIQWISRRSYFLYLWYYPVIVLYQAKVLDTSNDPNRHILIQLVLILIASETSYQFFEREAWLLPFVQSWGMKSNIRIMKDIWKRGEKKHPWSKTATLLCGAIVLVAAVGFVQAKTGEDPSVKELQEQITKNQKTIEAVNDYDQSRSRAINNIEGLNRDVILFSHDLKVTFIGDSILLAAADKLTPIFGQAVIDGAVSRQLYQTNTVLKSLKAEEKLYDTVVVFLGTNGTFTKEQMDEFLNAIGTDRTVFLVTTSVPRSWQNSANSQMLLAEQNYANVHILDWNTYSKGHDDWMRADLVHPNEEGARQLALYVAEGIYAVLNDDNGSN
ncbi:acyltransferase 3 [Trichococcus palustris]|uniref:Acyltransferase 3 n=1 Tax=Trichococcus palustris TaxID=140314 RepID=A0A143YBT1_9LACT|nr:acyltransferase family protein [Trichococcus palustris]CZQ86950.1 acyltransferase 3 [Trichococcus palustris]SFK80226.1 Peptidoglycan/LPS O-acetylase OafA/YrhL, contains acyltransferase and SGNH-hydrolase domains [Trichococcus palustris]